MGLERQIKRHSSERIRRKEGSLVISPIQKATLFERAKRDFQPSLQGGKIGDSELQTFINGHVSGFNVNGVSVLLVDQEHEKVGARIATIPRLYVQSPRTKAVGVEYFGPEVAHNVQRIPLVGDTVLSHVVKTLPERFAFGQEIVQEAKREGRPIIVADIANKPSYELYKQGSLFYAEGLLAFAASIHPLLAIPFAVNILNKYSQRVSEITGKGLFSQNRERSPLFENFAFDIEDARRVFVASGLIEKAYELSKNGQQDQQIVAFYPSAHNVGIGRYIEKEHAVKRIAYRWRPNLDYRLREYEWKDSEDVKGWERVSSRRLPLV